MIDGIFLRFIVVFNVFEEFVWGYVGEWDFLGFDFGEFCFGCWIGLFILVVGDSFFG